MVPGVFLHGPSHPRINCIRKWRDDYLCVHLGLIRPTQTASREWRQLKAFTFQWPEEAQNKQQSPLRSKQGLGINSKVACPLKHVLWYWQSKQMISAPLPLLALFFFTVSFFSQPFWVCGGPIPTLKLFSHAERTRARFLFDRHERFSVAVWFTCDFPILRVVFCASAHVLQRQIILLTTNLSSSSLKLLCWAN